MTQLTVNLSMDVPDGFVVVLKPRSDGGYTLRMQAEIARVVDETPKPAPKALSNGHEMAPPKRPFLFMKKSGAAALDVVNDLVEHGETANRHTFAAHAGCTPGAAASKLQNLYRYGHIRQISKATGRHGCALYALA